MAHDTADRHPLYQAALDADDAFHAACVAHMGAKDAWKARYMPAHRTPEIEALGRAKVVADAAWHAVMMEAYPRT